MGTAGSDKARVSKLIRGLRVFRKRRGAYALLCAGTAGAVLTLVALGVVLLLSDGPSVLSVRGPAASIPAPRDASVVQTHVAVVLDGTERSNFSHGLLRSLAYYSRGDLVVHAVVPADSLPGLAAALHGRAALRHYDSSRCEALVAPIWHIARKSSLASLCALFLADVVPAARVLYIDVRATVVSDVTPCAGTALRSPAVLALAPVLDASCTRDPDACYPLGFEWTPPSGLVCGATPALARSAGFGKEGPGCRGRGSPEPIALSPEVALMDLDRMRAMHFTDRLVQATLSTWRALAFRGAAGGAADLLNNFLRLYPEAVADLPCGCNYDTEGALRTARCAGRRVHLARGGGGGHGGDGTYARHATYFQRFPADFPLSTAQPPPVPRHSQVDSSWSAPRDDDGGGELVAGLRRHAPECPHQRFLCARDDREAAAATVLDIVRDRVFVLTRTSARPFFFAQMAASVAEQTHPFVTHVVGTDDPESRSGYLRTLNDVVMFDSKRHLFDAGEVCRKCRTPGGQCARAPSLAHPKERQLFFDCYCATKYPMNGYMNELHKHVGEGWILYLDDDNLLFDKFAISEFLATVQSHDALIAFRSHLGRVTPTDENFKKRVVMGDFDSSNFAFHSMNLRHAKWSSLRCGDFRMGAHLSTKLPLQWVDRKFIQANPMRSALGGLGGRADMSKASVTVVITSYQPTGWRPTWVREIIAEYTRPDIQHLIHKVLLVWNNMEVNVPVEISGNADLVRARKAGRFVIIRPSKNSLNNRWIDTLKHIETDIVLNLDDDVYVLKDGLVCMLSWLRREPTRMVGPFVRRIESGGKYVLDELLDSSKYSIVLPRILLLPTSYLRAYARKEYEKYHKYVDKQSAHCDDIFLNMVALGESKKPPLRVLLPVESVVDFYSKCWTTSKILTGGLGLQKGRTPRRNECVKALMKMYDLKQFKSIAHIATCLPRGNAVAKEPFLEADRYKQMKSNDFSCGPGEKANLQY